MASTDIMGNFSPMDELIQLIYQGIYQFVVMSSVTFDKWTVYVGVVGDAGRWWRGVWEERDVVAVVGPKPTEKLLETFVDKLVECVVGGDLFLTGFSTEKGAKIRLSFGTGVPRPVSMALAEIEAAEAAAHATSVFLEIALQAQSRKCRLHPSAFTSTTSLPTRETANSAGQSAGPSPSDSSLAKRKPRSVEHEVSGVDMEGVEENERKDKKQRLHSPPIEKTQPSVKVKAQQGSSKVGSGSLPLKKVRKIKAMDFESDDE